MFGLARVRGRARRCPRSPSSLRSADRHPCPRWASAARSSCPRRCRSSPTSSPTARARARPSASGPRFRPGHRDRPGRWAAADRALRLELGLLRELPDRRGCAGPRPRARPRVGATRRPRLDVARRSCCRRPAWSRCCRGIIEGPSRGWTSPSASSRPVSTSARTGLQHSPRGAPRAGADGRPASLPAMPASRRAARP